MAKPILNIDELQYQGFPGEMPESAKKKFGGAKLGWASRLIGAQKLGYSVIVIPPGNGKAAFQYHSHRTNEEAFFILEGEGEVRIGKETYAIRKGDFIAHPPGGPETAHQIRNTSDTNELKYIGISTQTSPEIAEYPDTNKFGVLGQFPGKNGTPELWRFVGRHDQALGYWDGE